MKILDGEVLHGDHVVIDTDTSGVLTFTVSPHREAVPRQEALAG